MKTRYLFIHFRKPISSWLWHCYSNQNDVELGYVSSKRRFVPSPATEFSADCLTDIAHFMGQLPKP